jgi:hypothetical protein
MEYFVSLRFLPAASLLRPTKRAHWPCGGSAFTWISTGNRLAKRLRWGRELASELLSAALSHLAARSGN